MEAIEQQSPGMEFDSEKFKHSIPEFHYRLDGRTATFFVTPVPGATEYWLYVKRSDENKYSRVLCSPQLEFPYFGADDRSYNCRIRAVRGGGDGQILSMQSKVQSVDLVTAAKARKNRLRDFFENLKHASAFFEPEDLDLAIHSLETAGLEARERQERRKLEEDALRRKMELERDERRRQAAEQRAAAIREKREAEHIRAVTAMDLPLDYVNSWSGDDRAGRHCGSMSDALMMSLDCLGMVDIEFISSVTETDMKEVIESLRGMIYQNPLYWDEIFYKGWETADEYLSGNLVHKYKIAKEANEKYKGYFRSNVTALEGIMGPELTSEEIYITLGSPWIPTDVIDDFITYMAFGNRLNTAEAKIYYEKCGGPDYAVRHDEYSGIWEIPKKTRFRELGEAFETACKVKYGTSRMEMLYILENTLNMKTISVTDAEGTGGKKRIQNREETLKALEKQRFMIETFQTWAWEEDHRKQRLQNAYNTRYGHVRRRTFDGSFLELPGLNPDIKLYDYQKNAVARILFSPNTLLAHDVGSGKTYIMIAAGMELRRLGKSKKNLYVIPNGLIQQWEQNFRTAYPEAKLLTVTIKNFDPKHRGETLLKIKNGDYDAILMTYSCFDMLDLSKKYKKKLHEERLKKLEQAEKLFKEKRTIGEKRRAILKALDAVENSCDDETSLIPFDELGINTLFVDEAHNYKNVKLESKICGVRGGGSASARGNAMMDKVHCIQRMNDGGRVVFATGTPITNSLSEIYILQKYLQEGELEYRRILSFDAWVAAYAEKTSEFEIDVDTNHYHLITRFSGFCNIPELTATLSSVADFHHLDKSTEIPELEGYDNNLLEGSEEFRDYLLEISNRADDVHSKRVMPFEDNMLKITTDGRKAALDMRLIDPAYGLYPDSKVIRCAENIYQVYSETRDCRGTQLVFCDSSTPKPRFNLYDDLKLLLISMGIPNEEIAFIHDAATDTARAELFDKVRSGEVAVLIGSTERMGHGMNVQKHLVALHHLDVPWRPSDMVQREGRILRQGNENKKVRIFRYITKASFDAYSWQLLEIKQRFISQIMSGDAQMRRTSDVDNTELQYAEVKALAVGNPKIKRRVEVCNELSCLRTLRKNDMEERENLGRIVSNMPGKIARQQEKILNCEKDIQLYRDNFTDYKLLPYEEQKKIRSSIYQAVQHHKNDAQDTEVLTYQGFKVVVPAYMVPRQIVQRIPGSAARQPIPYVHLVGNNSYYMEIESESGITARMNHLLNGLKQTKQDYEAELKEMERSLKAAQQELECAGTGHGEEIEALERELNLLNEELGLTGEE